MKRILLFLFTMLSCVSSFSQGLNIGVVVPEETTDGVDAKAFRTLSVKLEKLINKSGATSVNSGNIVLFPEMNFISDNMIEGGMRNIYSIDMELTVKAISLNKNTTFGSITWNLKGKGYSKSEAVKEAFGKIMPDDQRFVAFFNNIKGKIENYYVSNKNALLAQAKTLASQKQYEEAISILYEYPAGISGYADVQKSITNIYKQYQTANCSQILQEARAKFATQDYEYATALIADIDATSPCASEAKTLSNQIRQKINSDQQAERTKELEERKIAAGVEKARINAISNMVSSYYKSRPRVTYNTVIVRRW